jgi:glutamate/tyrosine decarboxylase-like PLP-dependent enzyme
VDDLQRILDIRKEMERKGLTFYVHVDAAWGGYFASVLHSKEGKSRSEVRKSTLKGYFHEKRAIYSFIDVIL